MWNNCFRGNCCMRRYNSCNINRCCNTNNFFSSCSCGNNCCDYCNPLLHCLLREALRTTNCCCRVSPYAMYQW